MDTSGKNNMQGGFGDALDNSQAWTYRAELGFMKALGIEVQDGAAYRGKPIKYSPRRATRIQDGTLGIGTNLAMRKLRLEALHRTSTNFWYAPSLTQTSGTPSRTGSRLCDGSATGSGPNRRRPSTRGLGARFVTGQSDRTRKTAIQAWGPNLTAKTTPSRRGLTRPLKHGPEEMHTRRAAPGRYMPSQGRISGRRYVDKGWARPDVADGWGPKELLALPRRWLDKLGELMGRWARVHPPGHLRHGPQEREEALTLATFAAIHPPLVGGREDGERSRRRPKGRRCAQRSAEKLARSHIIFTSMHIDRVPEEW